MFKIKYILLSAVSAAMVLVAGCTTQTATDIPVNTNTANTVVETVDTPSNDNGTSEEVVVNGDSTKTNTNTNTNIDEIDTSDWLTYINEEYGFRFKYPKEWVLSDNSGESYSPNTYSIVGVSTGGHYPSLGVVIKKLPMDDIVKEIYEFDAELSSVVVDETVSINNTNVRHIVKSGIDFPTSTYLVSLQDNVILVFDSISTYDKVVNTLVVE